MAALNYFPARVRATNADGTFTPEVLRGLNMLIDRSGGLIGNLGGETFVTSQDFSAVEGAQMSGGDVSADVVALQAMDSTSSEMVMQALDFDRLADMVMQPVSAQDRFTDVPQASTANAPSYQKGRVYFDTTLNKLRVGGATAYETVNSI